MLHDLSRKLTAVLKDWYADEECMTFVLGLAVFFCYFCGIGDGWRAYIALRQNIPLHGVVQFEPGRAQVGIIQYTVQELIIDSALLLLAGTTVVVIGRLRLHHLGRKAGKR